LTGRLDDCPITARLRDRLTRPVAGVETGNLVSRSQNPPQSLDVTQVKLPADATVANVNTRWVYGSDEYTITFVVHKEAGGWLVDDLYCLNTPGSSIYNPPGRYQLAVQAERVAATTCRLLVSVRGRGLRRRSTAHPS